MQDLRIQMTCSKLGPLWCGSKVGRGGVLNTFGTYKKLSRLFLGILLTSDRSSVFSASDQASSGNFTAVAVSSSSRASLGLGLACIREVYMPIDFVDFKPSPAELKRFSRVSYPVGLWGTTRSMYS